MDVTLGDSDRIKLKEVIQRMKSGEKGLHTKTVGPIKAFRVGTLPILLKDQLKCDLRKGSLKVLKQSGGILLCERKTL